MRKRYALGSIGLLYVCRERGRERGFPLASSLTALMWFSARAGFGVSVIHLVLTWTAGPHNACVPLSPSALVMFCN